MILLHKKEKQIVSKLFPICEEKRVSILAKKLDFSEKPITIKATYEKGADQCKIK
jgi:hypothetical protein